MAAITVQAEAVTLNGTVNIIETDIIAENGVIHLIDTVLMPLADDGMDDAISSTSRCLRALLGSSTRPKALPPAPLQGERPSRSLRRPTKSSRSCPRGATPLHRQNRSVAMTADELLNTELETPPTETTEDARLTTSRDDIIEDARTPRTGDPSLVQ